MNFDPSNRVAGLDPENQSHYYKAGEPKPKRGGTESDDYSSWNTSAAVPINAHVYGRSMATLGALTGMTGSIDEMGVYGSESDAGASTTSGASGVDTDDENVREHERSRTTTPSYMEADDADHVRTTGAVPARPTRSPTFVPQMSRPKITAKRVPYLPWDESIDVAKVCMAVSSQQNAKGVCNALTECAKQYVTMADVTLKAYQIFCKADQSRKLAVDVLKKQNIALQFQGKLEALLMLTESVAAPGIADGRAIAKRVLQRFQTPLSEVCRETLNMLSQDC